MIKDMLLTFSRWLVLILLIASALAMFAGAAALSWWIFSV